MFGRKFSNSRFSIGRNLRIEVLESRYALSAAAPTVTDVAVSSSLWESAFVEHLESSGLGTNGYSIPVGSPAQAHPLPWSNLDQISITFSEDVDVQASDLSISGLTNSWYAIDSFFYDPQTLQATWTLVTPLAEEERVHLDLDADGIDPVTDLDGNILDGEWFDEFSSVQSGNGIAGGDFEFRFNVINGDHFSNGLVNFHDYYGTFYSVGNVIGDPGYRPEYDNNGNGVIDNADGQAVSANLWGALPIGTPTGVFSDAPTTNGFSLTMITDRSSNTCLLYTSPSPRDRTRSRMPSSA